MNWLFEKKKGRLSSTRPTLHEQPKPFPPSWHKIKKQVGTGGCGVLDLYEDSLTKQKYIVKKSTKNNNMLLHQYRNLEYLRGQKICGRFLCPHGLFQRENKLFIAFNFLQDYVNLETLVDKDMAFLLQLSHKIIKEVQLLHEHQMVHMDIKPSNIMVNETTETVRIIDFGGAIIKRPNRMIYEAITWTPYYLSPEFQMKLKKQKRIVATFEEMQSNDIWALGMTLFYLFKNSHFYDYEEFNDFLNLSLQARTNFFDMSPAKRKL